MPDRIRIGGKTFVEETGAGDVNVTANSVDTERLYTAGRMPEVAVYKLNGTVYAIDKDGLVDSNTDAATVLQAAHDHLTNGGQITIKEGRYTISSTIQFDTDRITWKGSSYRSTELVMDDGVNAPMFQAVGSDDIYFNVWEDLYLDGNDANNTSGRGLDFDNGSAGTNSGRVRDAYIHRVFLSNFQDTAIYQRHAWGLRVYYSVIEFGNGWGIRIDQGRDAKIIGNKIAEQDEGMNIRGDNTQIIANLVQGCASHGIRIGGGTTANVLGYNILRDNARSDANGTNLFLNGNGVVNTMVGPHLIGGGNADVRGIVIRDGGSGGPQDTRLSSEIVFRDFTNSAYVDNGTRTRVGGVIGGGRSGGVDLSATTGQFEGDRAMSSGATANTGDNAYSFWTWDSTNTRWDDGNGNTV